MKGETDTMPEETETKGPFTLCGLSEFIKSGNWDNIGIHTQREDAEFIGKQLHLSTKKRITVNDYGPFQDLVICVMPCGPLEQNKLNPRGGVILVSLED